MTRLNQIVLVKEDWKADPVAAQYVQGINMCLFDELEGLMHNVTYLSNAEAAQTWQLCVEFAFPRIKPSAWQNGAVLTSHPLGEDLATVLHRWGKPVSSWKEASCRQTKKSNIIICPFNPVGPDAVMLACRLESLARLLAPALTKWIASPQNR